VSALKIPVVFASAVQPCLQVLNLHRRSGRHITPVRLALVDKSFWRAEFEVANGIQVMTIAGHFHPLRVVVFENAVHVADGHIDALITCRATTAAPTSSCIRARSPRSKSDSRRRLAGG
jgi:hypothetical protein